MRALAALVLSAVFAAVPAGAAMAAPEPAAQQAAPGPSPAASPEGGDRWGDGRVAVDPRDQPAHGTPYNWRQMTFGASIMLFMLGVVVWIIRRQTRSRRSS